MIEPPVLSLRPAMVLLKNAHYPNVVSHTRVTDHIHDFFIALDLVAEDVQDIDESEDYGEDDHDSDSPNVESESLGLDQLEASGVQKSPEKEQSLVLKAAEDHEAYNPGSPVQTADEGNLSNLDIGGAEYLSMLDSNVPYQMTTSQLPSVAIGTDNESVIPTAQTTVVDQQTDPLYTQSISNQTIQIESERVGLKRPSIICVDEETALPDSKRPKILSEATVNENPIHLTKPNTSSPSHLIEEEMDGYQRRGYGLSTSNHYIVQCIHLTRASKQILYTPTE